MNDFKQLLKKLPESTNTFSLEEKGVATSIEYGGEFTAKIPNLKMHAKIAQFKKLLNGGEEAGLDVGTLNLHHQIAYLKHVLIDFPLWWKDSDYGYDLYDINVIESIYESCIKFENDWVEAAWGKKDEQTKS